jgi:hypothetical protein
MGARPLLQTPFGDDSCGVVLDENRIGTKCVSRSVKRTLALLTLALVLLVPAGCGGDDSGGGGGGGGTNTTKTDSDYGY